MIEVKKFSGVLDLDNAISEVSPTSHIDALNAIFRGTGANKRVQNIRGNTLIVNAALPVGDNQHLGSFYDDVRQRIYWFNWNSGGANGFYYYDLKTNTIVSVLICLTDTDTDIFEFDLDRPIASINILYGDDDIVYFLDSLKRPTYINVNKVIAGDYGQVRREYIDVAKSPSILPPMVTYENDTSVTVNNLKNALFQFRYRYVGLNNEKPVWSTGSIVPLPNSAANSSVADNARIAVYLETGGVDIKEIEVAVKIYTNNNVSDWLKVTSLDKDELSIPDNGIYRFVFYNDEMYTAIPTEGSDLAVQELQLQDLTPIEANAQELLNGNVIIYGGIKEGLIRVTPDLSATTSRVANYYNQYNGLLFFVVQNSDHQITLYLTGTGTNDGSGNPTTLNNALAKFSVSAKRDTGANRSFEITNASDTTTTAIFDDLVTAAGLQGFTETSRTTNTLVLGHTDTIILANAYFSYTTASTIQQVRFAFAPDARYSFGIVYYDSKGRTNGVVNAVDWNVNTPTFNYVGSTFSEIPKVTLTISHRPPLWASYYHIVRTDDNTYQKRTTWVTGDAIADENSVSSITNTLYAYVDISNMNLYSTQLSTTGESISYELVAGDRIRFMGRYSDAQTLEVFDEAKDYEIIGIKDNPYVNGKRYTGRFIQIEYPANDIDADFKFDGATGFRNYYILLYNYRRRLDEERTVFYEFGKKFGIGDAGLVTAYHFGLEQTQTANLATPALISVVDGDYFFRYRNVPIGAEYSGSDQTFEFLNSISDEYNTIPVTFADAPIVTVTGTLNNQTANMPASIAAGSYPDDADTDCVYENTTTGSIRLRIQCHFSYDTDETEHIQLLAKIVNTSPPFASVIISDLQNPVYVHQDAGAVEGDIDIYINIPPGAKAFILVYKTIINSDLLATITNFKVTPIIVATIPLFEKTYSDHYPIRANSNSRALVIDEDARETYNSTLLRWSLAYQQGTNINQVNRFYPINFDEIDKSKGDIQRMKARERILRIFQNRGVAKHGIYTRFIRQATGEQGLITTDNIITANNVDYYSGEFGLGDQYTSLVPSTRNDYFADPVKGVHVRVSDNGMDILNELWGCEFFVKNKLTPYNKTWLRSNGSIARILGYFDTEENQYVTVLQGGTNGVNTIPDFTLAFEERATEQPSYTSPYSYHPEGILCAQNVTYSWRLGQLYVHNSNTYCNFYGTQYDTFITLPFNNNIFEKKIFQSLSQYGSQVWPCTLIYTDTNSYGSQRQESNLVGGDFRLSVGKQQAALLRDIHSIGSISNGAKLNGSILVVKFHIVNASAFAYLAIVEVKFNSKQLTPK